MDFQMKNANAQYKLLVVDDDDSVRTALAKALSLQGYVVEEAASGAEALALLRAIPFTLMVLDMKMPGMDGVTVMKKSREIQLHLLILVLTAHPSVDNAIAAVKSRAVDYLQKPVTTRQLCDTVNNLLQTHIKRVNKEKLVDAIAGAVDSWRVENQPLSVPLTAPIGDETDIVCVSPIVLDKTSKHAMVDGAPGNRVMLSDGECLVLAHLMENPNRVLTARQMAYRLWEDDKIDASIAQNLIRPYISRLRAKLPVLKAPPQILHTVRGRGYMFVPRKVRK